MTSVGSGMGGLDVLAVGPSRELTYVEQYRCAVRLQHQVLAAMPDASRSEQQRALRELLDALGIREALAEGEAGR